MKYSNSYLHAFLTILFVLSLILSVNSTVYAEIPPMPCPDHLIGDDFDGADPGTKTTTSSVVDDEELTIVEEAAVEEESSFIEDAWFFFLDTMERL